MTMRICPQNTTDRHFRASGGRFRGTGTHLRSRKTRSACPVAVILFLSLFFSISILPTPGLSAREDSASLLFRKTAGIYDTRVYIVEKGDRIADILQYKLGAEKIPYSVIRRMNPKIRDLNRIYPGQEILFPILEKPALSKSQPSPPETPPLRPPSAASPDKEPAAEAYKIKEGDSISRIILTELKVNPPDALPTYRLIRELNPGISDPNTLQAGTLLKLPPDLARERTSSPEPRQATPSLALTIGNETTTPPSTTPPPTTRMSPAAEALLGTIRSVIGKMKGSVTASGNYFIPIRENAQITIDCSLIPVAELDDGTTVFLDFENRLSEDLKGLIRQGWPGAGFLAREELRDGLSCLRGIIRASRNYTMAKTDGPFTLTTKPEILVFTDWMISGKAKAGLAPYLQGLFLLGDANRPLSADEVGFIQKNGLYVTEIREGRTVTSVPATAAAPAPVSIIPDLKGLNGISFAERFLNVLGEKPARNSEVKIFEQSRDGFNLSVAPDLLLWKGGKRYILHSKKLPEQFVRILQTAGTELIFCGDQETGRPFVETLLRGISMPFSFGYFSFRIPEDDKRPRLAVSFAALKTMVGGEPLYLIDFDLPPEARILFQSSRGGRIIRY